MIKFHLTIAAVLALVALVLTIDRAWTENAVLQQQLADTKRIVDVLTAERAASAMRERIVDTARSDIVSAPAADDGSVAPILRRALEAADQIGGIQ